MPATNWKFSEADVDFVVEWLRRRISPTGPFQEELVMFRCIIFDMAQRAHTMEQAKNALYIQVRQNSIWEKRFASPNCSTWSARGRGRPLGVATP
ncbi:hypothetical protein VTN96DRAFT_3032 [Rasamsonia emersonii]